MDSLKEIEKQKYTRIWDVPTYRIHSPGERYALNFIEQFNLKKGDEVLDVGCGTGKAAKIFVKKKLNVHGIDIAENSVDEDIKLKESFYFSQECIWQMSSKVMPTDYVYCTDVMEHIPTTMVHPALWQIASKMKIGGFFSISTVLDSYGPKFINEQLHLTVRGGRWWADQLERYWDVSWGEDPNNPVNFLYYVRVRKETDAEWKPRD